MSSALPSGPSQVDHDLELGRTDVATQLSLVLLQRLSAWNEEQL
jgi:hypothetical protein